MLIQNNTVYRISPDQAYGIRSWAPESIIRKNLVYLCDKEGIRITTLTNFNKGIRSNLIEANIVLCNGTGLSVNMCWNDHAVIVRNNFSAWNSNLGLQAKHVTNVLIEHNTFIGNWYMGIDLHGSSRPGDTWQVFNVRIKNNIFYTNMADVFIYNPEIFLETVDYNFYEKRVNGWIGYFDWNINHRYTNLQNFRMASSTQDSINGPYEIHGLEGYAGFTDPDLFDFSLNGFSPARNKAEDGLEMGVLVSQLNKVGAGENYSLTNIPDPALLKNCISIKILGPANNENVCGIEGIKAEAIDTSGIANVQFKIDNTVIGNGIKIDTNNVYKIVWDTRAVSEGSHALFAVMTSTSGQTRTSPGVQINVIKQAPFYTEQYIEAEDAVLTFPLVFSNDISASGGKYIASQTWGKGSARFNFTVGIEGTYYIFAKVMTPSPASSHDSFYTTMDDILPDTILEVWDFADNPSIWGWDILNWKNGDRAFHLSSGMHTILLQARESDTRIDQIYITQNQYFIPEAPIVSGIPADFLTNQNFFINLMVNKNYGYWSTNGSSFESFTTTGVSLQITKTTILQVFGQDIAGRTSATNTFMYTVDDSPPFITGYTPTNSQPEVLRSSVVVIRFSEIMRSLSIHQLTISNSRETVAGSWVQNPAEIFQFTPFSELGAAGEKIFVNIKAVQDLAGNACTTSNFSFFLSSNTPPFIAITNITNWGLIGAGGSINGIASDIDGNLDRIEFSLNNYDYSAANGLASWDVKASSIPEGTNLLYVRAVDSLGDICCKTIYVNADKTKPHLFVRGGIGTNDAFDKPTNICVEMRDIHPDGFTWRIGNSAYRYISNTAILNLCLDKSGVYTIDIIGRDAAQNESQLRLEYFLDISLVNTDGLSERAKKFVKKINDMDMADRISDIKNRSGGIAVIEHLATKSTGTGTAATIVTRNDDFVLVVCSQENGIASQIPKSIVIYDRTGNMLRRLDLSCMRGPIALWDKRDARGNMVPDGLYFLIANYPTVSVSIPIIILDRIK
ncbi:MAG: hypothetical protein A2096_11300 [Spirochaetes bacterium GWF1_41_5]|nr:MAG: hypothetical protein A2096_11300 [Spirochaetes bacterium GWF1_41_5]